MKRVAIRCVIEKHHHRKTSFAILLFLTTMFIASFTLTPHSGFASPQNNNTSVQSEGTPSPSSSSSSIPEAAIGPTIPPEKGYLVEEIRDGLYWVTDGSYNTMFLVTDEGVVAVDAPPSIGANYIKAISEVTDKPITYVIYSHSHLDHIGAAAKHLSRECHLYCS